MKEIEVKAKILNIENIKNKLIGMGCLFGIPLIQEDIIFLAQGVEFPDITKGTAVVRVRKSNDITTLTLKKRIAAEIELIKLEKEIVVSDKQEAVDIVKHMGYHEVVRVSKKRLEGKHDGMTICIDEVDGLGNFIEVEKLTEDNNDVEIQESLFNLLESLGVNKQDRVVKGYDALVYESMI